MNEWMKKRGKKFPYSLTIKKKCHSKKVTFQLFVIFDWSSTSIHFCKSQQWVVLPSFLTITWKGWTQRTISVYWFATTLSTDVIQYWHCCLRQYCQHILMIFVIAHTHTPPIDCSCTAGTGLSTTTNTYHTYVKKCSNRWRLQLLQKFYSPFLDMIFQRIFQSQYYYTI